MTIFSETFLLVEPQEDNDHIKSNIIYILVFFSMLRNPEGSSNHRGWIWNQLQCSQIHVLTNRTKEVKAIFHAAVIS